MILNRIFTTYTFRFMFSYVMVLSITVFVLLAIVYSLYSHDEFNRVQQSIARELDRLEARYREAGEAGVQSYVLAQNARGDQSRFFYLLADRDHRKLAGDLDAWPDFRDFSQGWLSFEREVLTWDESAEHREFMARSRSMADGRQLLVARHYSDLVSNGQLMLRMLARGMLITICLGVIGGAWSSLAMLREIEAINQGVKGIMGGDLSERIPISGRGGDIEVLVANFNNLLDRIQSLMNGVRQVSDNIAHDLRTPLTRLRNHLADMERHGGVVPREEMQAMLAEADGLLATFNGLLRIAQVESGHRRSAFAPLELRAILRDVVEFYEPLAHDKEQVLELDLDGEVTVTGDRDLLFQALANILDNAIKYTPRLGRIAVSLSHDAAQARVEVADNGPGIAEEKREKVFERFYRIEASRGREPGNGLGLSLVAAVAKLHEGRVVLGDNHPGLKVILYLPA